MPFKIKLCGIIKRIIDKYRREVAGTNLVLPVPDIAYCNRILKRIAVEVGIDKAVTYHLRRHTFATTNALVQGIRIEVVNRCRFPAGLRRSLDGHSAVIRREYPESPERRSRAEQRFADASQGFGDLRFDGLDRNPHLIGDRCVGKPLFTTFAEYFAAAVGQLRDRFGDQ